VAGVWILLCLAAVVGLAVALGRRGLARRAARVQAAWLTAETELQRRHDRVAELLGMISGAPPDGDAMVSAVARALEGASTAVEMADRTMAENRLTYALCQLLARPTTDDDAPQQERLRVVMACGQALAGAAREYNSRVMALNEQIARFPWRLVAGGHRPAEYLILDEPGDAGA
jgi:hypothetical protein